MEIEQQVENEFGEVNKDLPFPKILSQYYVPSDPTDPNYIQSFELNEPEKIKSFFNHFGFVVIRNLLNESECKATINEIYNVVESEGKFRRDDINTWDDKFWPKDSMLKHGMPSKPPIFTTQFLLNRQNPDIYRAFSIVLGTDDLLVSHDRASFLRPTKSVVLGNQIRDMTHWRTATNIHMDMSPWDYLNNPQKFENLLKDLKYGHHLNHFIFENNQVQSTVNNGLHVQGVLNLADNFVEDGGFQVVPGFKNHFNQWTSLYKDSEIHKTSVERGSVPISANDPLNSYAVRVSMRAGSLVIWDQRTPHGAVSNNSSRPRFAQFMKMFPAQPIDSSRLAARSETVLYMCKKANFLPLLTPLGAHLFGLPASLVPKPSDGKAEEKFKKRNRVQGSWSGKS